MSFKITGLDAIQKKLDKMAKAASPSEQARALRAFRCSEHGTAPTDVKVSGERVTAEFCCAAARKKAMKGIEDSITRSMR